MKQEWRKLFYGLWTKATGTEGYVKAEWGELERILERHSREQPNPMPAQFYIETSGTYGAEYVAFHRGSREPVYLNKWGRHLRPDEVAKQGKRRVSLQEL